MWTPDDWAQFKGPRRLTNPLTLLHEATHWCRHRGLVSHCMTLLTIQALKNKDDARLPNAELDKVLALRALLAPFGEGLALYAQYDYFPANFFGDFGTHSSFDSLVEYVLRADHRYMKDEGRHSTNMHRLLEDTHAFYETVRMSEDALRRKRDLLRTPFFSGEPHITGYVLVKEIVARIRLFPRFQYVHDGLVLDALTSYVFDCPILARCLLDSRLEGQAFVEEVSRVLAGKLDFLLDQKSAGEMFFRLSRSMERASVDGFPVDTDALDAAWHQYNDRFDEISGDYLRSSVADYIGAEESMDDYLDRYDSANGEWINPVSADTLTYLYVAESDMADAIERVEALRAQFGHKEPKIAPEEGHVRSSQSQRKLQ